MPDKGQWQRLRELYRDANNATRCAVPFAVFALIVSLIPRYGVIGMLPAVIGFACGILGAVASRVNKDGTFWLSIWAAVLCIVAVGFLLPYDFVFGSAVR